MKRNICLCYGLANKVRTRVQTIHRKQDGGRKVDRHRKNKNPGKKKLSHKDKVATKELKIKCKVQIDEHTGTKARQHTLMRG